MDDVASLITLAQYDPATCYERLGNHAKAEPLIKEAKSLWGRADPDLHNALK